jgi:uncharacterized protein (TIGR00251 family)
MSEKPETIIRVKVLPKSSVNQLEGLINGIYKIKLTAPPVEGKANKGLQQFLAKKLGIAKSNIEIASGEKGREKLIKICGVSVKETHRILGE